MSARFTTMLSPLLLLAKLPENLDGKTGASVGVSQKSFNLGNEMVLIASRNAIIIND